MIRSIAVLFVMSLLVLCAWGAAAAEPRVISKTKFEDKLKGAWAGQMVGVCFGWPYEFRSNAKPILDPLQPWSPERVRDALNQDDVYVEMTFLKALEKYGLDITFAEAGAAFGATEYQLWHANLFARENILRGVMPPLSGHPFYNQHANDIDFQIESDLIGIICPGMPRESNRLCDVFGRIMNYGDGVYGGMFVAAMYTAAYFEDDDVSKVIEAGLGAIPPGSRYYKTIADVVQWHKESPDDWLSVWNRVEEKWQDDEDCLPESDVNINASLNGAYIVMGLLYGEGDFAKTIEISTRCGQDADCNPSNAAGILGCMKGFSGLEADWVSGIDAIAGKNFFYTDYSWDTLIPACVAMTEEVIRGNGGSVSDTEYRIATQEAAPPDLFEQWTPADTLGPITQRDVDLWQPEWRLIASGKEMGPGYQGKEFGRSGILKLHPVDQERPAAIERTYQIPDTASPKLLVDAASYKSWRGEPQSGDYVLKIFVDRATVSESLVASPGQWETIQVDMAPFAGKAVTVRIENHANGWHYEGAYLDKVRLEP